ncbi:hypothetical protein Pcinc_012716 [Petrolisthes cinctipes]|uniref:Uncharacterized protein n=1 Tax=Petrolisthes cinctipes TaxID=88211 RepID=A0AAE1KV21_PETCI|nr:hypothetical protein Pcinc_012716 [Petrolisthes cinctipes]
MRKTQGTITHHQDSRKVCCWRQCHLSRVRDQTWHSKGWGESCVSSIYLFARLVEVGSREEVQGAGVRLLMVCIQALPQLAAQYEGLRGSSLLYQALCTPLATPGVYTGS